MEQRKRKNKRTECSSKRSRVTRAKLTELKWTESANYRNDLRRTKRDHFDSLIANLNDNICRIGDSVLDALFETSSSVILVRTQNCSGPMNPCKPIGSLGHWEWSSTYSRVTIYPYAIALRVSKLPQISFYCKVYILRAFSAAWLSD